MVLTKAVEKVETKEVSLVVWLAAWTAVSRVDMLGERQAAPTVAHSAAMMASL